MEQMMSDVWKVIIAAIVSTIGTYMGFINKMRSQISVLEEKVKKLEESKTSIEKKLEDVVKLMTIIEEKMKHVEQRQDSHSKKNDEIVKLITDFKIEIVQKLGSLDTNIGKLSRDVDNINRTFTVFDEGIDKKRE